MGYNIDRSKEKECDTMEENNNRELSEEIKDEIKKIAEIFVDAEDKEKAGKEAAPAIENLIKRFNISSEHMEKINKEIKKQIKECIKSRVSVSISGKNSKKPDRKKGKSLIANLKDYTVIDLETTSQYPTSAEIIEMSAVKIRNSEIVDTYSTLIKPSESLSSSITELTGITNEMLSNAPKIEEKIQEYLDFISDDVILGHNIASYDSIILYDLCENLGLKTFDNDILDTLRYSRCCDIDVLDYKLTTLTEYFKIEHNAHRALNDCIANFECYEKLKEYFKNVYSCSVNTCYSELNGKSVVLTGKFSIGLKEDVQAIIEEMGATVKTSVSSKTDYLIIGSLGGEGNKVLKAEELQLKGKPIKIVKENEFFYFGQKQGEIK